MRTDVARIEDMMIRFVSMGFHLRLEDFDAELGPGSGQGPVRMMMDREGGLRPSSAAGVIEVFFVFVQAVVGGFIGFFGVVVGTFF